MLKAKTIIQRIQRRKEEVVALGVKRLSIFGSFARGEAKPRSDVDFLVEFDKGRGGHRDYLGLVVLLQDLCGGREVDVVKRHLVREELRGEILGGTQIEAKI